MNELVSIVIPVYNTADDLHQCLLSITNQTYKNIEIIVINDGSTDNSLEILEDYRKKDKRIVLFNNTNHGASYSRNYGIGHANGKFILFIDSDDYISLDYVKKLVTAIKTNDVNLAICRYKTFFKKQNQKTGKVLGPDYTHSLNNDFFYLCSLGGLPYGPWGKIYKLNIIKEHNIRFLTEISNGEDQIFNLSYFRYVKNYCFVNEEMYFYQLRNNSLSKKHSKKSLEDLYVARNKLIEYLEEENVPYYQQIIAAHCMTDLIDYVSVDGDGYDGYKKRILKVKTYLEEGMTQKSLKARVFRFLIHHEIIFPFYLIYRYNVNCRMKLNTKTK